MILKYFLNLIKEFIYMDVDSSWGIKKKEEEEQKITLVELVKIDMSIKEVTETTWNRIHVADLD